MSRESKYYNKMPINTIIELASADDPSLTRVDLDYEELSGCYSDCRHRPSYKLSQVLELLEVLKLNTRIEELSLNFYNCEYSDHELLFPGLVNVLQENTTIKHLNIIGCRLKDNKLFSLASGLNENTSLVSLNISNNRITTSQLVKILKALRNNTNLTQLHINGNDINNNVFLELGQLLKQNRLLELGFGDVDPSFKIQKSGYKSFTKQITICSLTALSVTNIQINKHDYLRLANAIKNNTNLLNLSFGVYIEGVKHQEQVCGLLDIFTNKSIQNLILSIPWISPKERKTIYQAATALEDNNSLKSIYWFSGFSGGSNDILRGLVNNKSVNKLTLNSLTAQVFHEPGIRISEVIQDILLHNKALDELAIVDFKANAKLIASGILENKTLRKLTFSRSQVDSGGINSICNAVRNNSSLKELYLYSRDKQIESNSYNIIARLIKNNTSLTTFVLDNTIKPEKCAEICLYKALIENFHLKQFQYCWFLDSEYSTACKLEIAVNKMILTREAFVTFMLIQNFVNTSPVYYLPYEIMSIIYSYFNDGFNLNLSEYDLTPRIPEQNTYMSRSIFNFRSYSATSYTEENFDKSALQIVDFKLLLYRLNYLFPSKVTLNLTKLCLNKDELKILANSLQQNNNLQNLTLIGKRVKSNVLKTIFNSLIDSPLLTELNLHIGSVSENNYLLIYNLLKKNISITDVGYDCYDSRRYGSVAELQEQITQQIAINNIAQYQGFMLNMLLLWKTSSLGVLPKEILLTICNLAHVDTPLYTNSSINNSSGNIFMPLTDGSHLLQEYKYKLQARESRLKSNYRL